MPIRDELAICSKPRVPERQLHSLAVGSPTYRHLEPPDLFDKARQFHDISEILSLSGLVGVGRRLFDLHDVDVHPDPPADVRTECARQSSATLVPRCPSAI